MHTKCLKFFLYGCLCRRLLHPGDRCCVWGLKCYFIWIWSYFMPRDPFDLRNFCARSWNRKFPTVGLIIFSQPKCHRVARHLRSWNRRDVNDILANFKLFFRKLKACNLQKFSFFFTLLLLWGGMVTWLLGLGTQMIICFRKRGGGCLFH